MCRGREDPLLEVRGSACRIFSGISWRRGQVEQSWELSSPHLRNVHRAVAADEGPPGSRIWQAVEKRGFADDAFRLFQAIHRFLSGHAFKILRSLPSGCLHPDGRPYPAAAGTVCGRVLRSRRYLGPARPSVRRRPVGQVIASAMTGVLVRDTDGASGPTSSLCGAE